MKVSRKSIIIVSVTALSVIAASIVWLVVRQLSVPDFSDKKPEEIAEYIRSDEFRNLDRDARRTTTRAAMGQMMTSQVNEYFELPAEQRIAYLDKVIETMQSRRSEFETQRRNFGAQRDGSEAERRDFRTQREGSDARRREYEAQREQTQLRTDAQDNRRQPRWQGRRRGRRRSPERMRARSEFGDPKIRAQRAKFRQALRQRMIERGVSFGPPGR